MDLYLLTSLFGLAFNAQSLPIDQAAQELYRKIDQVCLYHTDITPIQKNAFKKSGRNYLYERFVGNKISPEEIDRHIKAILSYLTFGNYCALNPLPSTLPHLTESDLLNIFAFTAPRQTDGFSCGYWTVALALAAFKAFHNRDISSSRIAEDVRSFLLTKGREWLRVRLGRGQADELLTSMHEDIRYLKLIEAGICSCEDILAPHFPHFRRREHLDAEHVFRLSEAMSLEGRFLHNFHILSFSGGRSEGIFFDQTEPSMPAHLAAGHYSKEQLRDLYTAHIFNDFANRNETIHCFACFLHLDSGVGHWIPIVLAKLPQRKPVMILFDSLNFPIQEKSDAVAYIDFLFQRFMRPFYQAQQHARNLASDAG